MDKSENTFNFKEKMYLLLWFLSQLLKKISKRNTPGKATVSSLIREMVEFELNTAFVFDRLKNEEQVATVAYDILKKI